MPIGTVDAFYADVHSIEDLPPALKEQIEHFFGHYKDLEHGKWVRLSGWGSASEAADLITRAIDKAAASV